MEKMRSFKVLTVAGLVLGLTSSGWAQATTPPGRYVSLLIQDTGGYTIQEYAFSRTPTVLYSDGLLIVPIRVQNMRYPGKFVAGFLQKREQPAVSRILEAARKVNLMNPKFDWGMPGIVDVNDTTFITQISPRATQTKFSIFALGYDQDVRPKSKLEARRAVSKFREKVESFSPEYMWTKSRPTIWKPTKWLYMATEADPDPTFTKIHKWIGSKPLQSTRSCMEMTNAENIKFNALLPKLDSASRFSSNGKTWLLTVRPLFPHENGCQSIIN
jgi:hypothetical protein